MRAAELMTHVPGITMDHLHNWERQGYLTPGRIKVGKKRIRNYSEKDIRLIKAMWFYYQQGLSPKNAHRNATANGSQRSSVVSSVPDEPREVQERETDSLEGIAIFELVIPLRNYFNLKMGRREHGWATSS
ncbi:MAG: MerR family transcriptional regulator [Deltaproteobacteria bacterium]|jgi:DNA-binding transcriptional MerR regulator